MKVYGLTPINGSAASVTTQSGCTDTVEATRKTLLFKKNKLTAEFVYKRKALGITKKSWRGIRWKLNSKGIKPFPEAMKLIKLADNIQRLNVQIKKLKDGGLT